MFQLAHDPICGFPTKLKLLYTPDTARTLSVSADLARGSPLRPLMRDSAHPLPGPSTTPTCIVRRPGPRLRPGRQRRTRAGADRPGIQASAHMLAVPTPPIDKVQFPKLALSTSRPFLRLHFYNSQSCDCPVGVERAPESNCSLRRSRMPRSPRFQLQTRPPRNLPPRAISCTRVKHRQRPRYSRAP